MSFFMRIWYMISQFFTGFGGAKMPHFQDVIGILEALKHGTAYRADRKVFGAMLHPFKVQARMNKDKRIGDCEDHAAYWACALRRSLIAFEVYIGCLYYKQDGKQLGHAVVVFRPRNDSRFFWADYHMPQPLAYLDAWHQDVFAVYGRGDAKFLGAMLYSVDEHGIRDQLRLKHATLYPLQKR
jgi:hypothetical protein